ncbi:MAG: type II toxin-antitoxin system Phd/YefM family antitoxin [Parachlamydiales bacterium]
MEPREISTRELRAQQADVLNSIAYGGEHFIITRHGKETAALISMNEFWLLQETLEAMEETEDLQDAMVALKEAREKGTISLKQMAKELGIDVPSRNRTRSKKATKAAPKKRRQAGSRSPKRT